MPTESDPAPLKLSARIPHLDGLLWRGLVLCMLAFVFGMVVYRAKTQTIAHDEALEYEWFLDSGVAHVLSYNPANHMLFTLLAKPIVWSLGNREIILRSPSLLGTAIYLLAAYLLCKRLFGQGVLFFLSVALLTLNPQILDFMPAVRGYILGLAFLATAMYFMARMGERGELSLADFESKWCCSLASISLALSVSAGLTNVVPAVCIALAFSAAAMGDLDHLLRLSDARLQRFTQYFLAPGAVVGFCILWPYMIQFRLGSANVYKAKASDVLRDVFNSSFLYKWTDDTLNGLGALPSAPGSWQARLSDFGAYVLFPAVFLLVLTGFFLARRAQRIVSGKQSSHTLVFAGAALASILLIVFLHLTIHIDYPVTRYCLFLIPLFELRTRGDMGTHLACCRLACCANLPVLTGERPAKEC